MSHGSQRDGLSTFFGLFGRRTTRRQPLRIPRLRSAESLERRQMLAADVDPEGVLLITGSEKADKIVISAGVEDGTVILKGVPGVAKNTVYTGVKAIIVNAGGGNDDIRIGSNIRGVEGGLIGVIVNAGTGNDRVEGGDGDDSIDGGSGNDNLRGRNGDDTIRGGGGNDDVRGENGDDVCFGDTGRDVLRGGNDDDSLSGGANDDKLFGDTGDDSLDGDEGRDKLYGGLGNDDDYDDNDGLEDEDEDDEGENEGGDDDDSAGATTITFSGNAAGVGGTSAGKYDKVFYVFTAPTTGLLSVTLQPGVGGRYADLELEDVLTSVDLLELEPSEGGPTTGLVNVTSGRQYKMRLRSPDLALVSYTVDLSIAPAT
ncbi:MAG: calcium-binding protein [Planctomycetaceae bacterium]